MVTGRLKACLWTASFHRLMGTAFSVVRAIGPFSHECQIDSLARNRKTASVLDLFGLILRQRWGSTYGRPISLGCKSFRALKSISHGSRFLRGGRGHGV